VKSLNRRAQHQPRAHTVVSRPANSVSDVERVMKPRPPQAIAAEKHVLGHDASPPMTHEGSDGARVRERGPMRRTSRAVCWTRITQRATLTPPAAEPAEPPMKATTSSSAWLRSDQAPKSAEA
jgi:hypothetical protein